MPDSTQPDWKAYARQVEKERDNAIKVLRMVQKKHCRHDDSIGWQELADAVNKVLGFDRLRRAMERDQAKMRTKRKAVK